MREIIKNLREKHIIGRLTVERIVGPQAHGVLALHGISTVGVSQAGKEFYFSRLNPNFGQVLVCCRGCGLVLQGDEMFRCEPGMAYLTPPGKTHCYHALPNEEWTVCWIMYRAKVRDCPTLSVEAPMLVACDSKPLESSIEALYREAGGPAEPAIMLHWSYLISAYGRRAILPRLRLGKLWDEVRAHLQFEWDIDRMAEIACASAEHLRRLSITETGRSPMRYVTELRMREAAAMLSSERYTVEDVAERVGYNNPYAFSTAFKRVLGVPPSKYRQVTDLAKNKACD